MFVASLSPLNKRNAWPRNAEFHSAVPPTGGRPAVTVQVENLRYGRVQLECDSALRRCGSSADLVDGPARMFGDQRFRIGGGFLQRRDGLDIAQVA